MTSIETDNSTAFCHGHGHAEQWQDAVAQVLASAGPIPPGANLGFLYISDKLGTAATDILAHLRQVSGIEQWVGSVGLGVLANGIEYLGEPAVAVLFAKLPTGEFSVFSTTTPPPALGSRSPSGAEAAHFAIAHGDPQTDNIATLIEELSANLTSGYIVGGLSSSRSRSFQIADQIVQGGLSGVVLSSEVGVAIRLTQGCAPLRHADQSPLRHIITEAQRNVIITLDGRPALDVLKEAIGEALANDLNRAARFIHVGLPVPGSDTGDYLARNIVGIDPQKKLVAIGAYVEPGMPILFCKRDGASAREDLLTMLDSISRDVSGPPKGGLYFACLGRGEHMFGERSVELGIIRERLGDFPLVGFFCNGEIAHNRLYGYTGVLMLFR